jgi:HD domain
MCKQSATLGECGGGRATGSQGFGPRLVAVSGNSSLTEEIHSLSLALKVSDRGRQIRRAFRFAASAHQGQVRKVSGRPFIVHPAGVARLIYSYGGRTELIVAALLHDTVEDAGVSLAAIEATFGADVAGLVAGVTREERRESWREQKERALAKLASAPEECLVLKCADALDNFRSIRRDALIFGEFVWQKLRSKDEVFWYYRALSELFSAHLTTNPGHRLWLDLAAEIDAGFE